MIDTDALKAGADLLAVVGSYTQLTRKGSEWVGRCLAHAPDDHPSMSVVPRKGFVHCFSCGWNADVIEVVMLAEHCDFKGACEKLGAPQEWTPINGAGPVLTRAPKEPPRITSTPPADAAPADLRLHEKDDATQTWSSCDPEYTWPYFDAEGRLLGYVCRYSRSGGEAKEIRCITWGRRGDAPEGWGCGHWTEPRPLYGLDRLATRPSAPVVVVEGEKAADAAGRLLPAYVAVTWPGGAKATHKADWSPLVRRSVLLWPDADTAGIEAMEAVGATLYALDPKQLRILTPDGHAYGWDAADAERDGWTGAQVIDWARERVRAYTPPLLPATSPEPAGSPQGHADQTPTDPSGPKPPKATSRAARAAAALQPVPAKPKRQRGPITDAPSREGRPRLASVEGRVVLGPDASEGPALPEALSDDQFGQRFALKYGDTWKYVPEWSDVNRPVWFYWAEDGWHRDVLNSHYNLAIEMTRQALDSAEGRRLTPNQRRALNSAGKASSILQVAKHSARIAAHNRLWDADPWLLGVPGGVIDLREGTLLKAAPDDYITRRTVVAPKEGPHPLFDKVLSRASQGEPEVTKYLWRWFGYLLTGDVREEAFLFLHGRGGCGKGTLVKVIADILGGYATPSAIDTFTEGKASRHPQEIAKLDGVRFTYASETEEGRRWNESLIKWLTGRDKLTARFMRQNDFEFNPQFKLLIYGNHRPMVRSVGEEMRRRIHLIEYAGSIPEDERDTTLKDKLLAEYPAILHSMITGCLDWQELGGLHKPQVILESVEEYLTAEDVIGAWVEDCCDVHPSYELDATVGYESFHAWMKSQGEYMLPSKRWAEQLSSRGYPRVRGRTSRIFAGLRLKYSGAFQDSPPLIPDRY